MNRTRCATRAGLPLLLFTLVLAACGDSNPDPQGAATTPAGPAGPASGAAEFQLHPNIGPATDAVREGRLEEARLLLEEVPEADSSYLVALQQLATVHASLGRAEAAVDAYVRLTSIQTDNPELFVGRSWAEFQGGNALAAELSSLRALELAPDALAPRYNVAFFRLVQGRLPEASQAYHRAMKRDFAMEYVSVARGHLLRLQQDRPDFADVHFILAAMANALGNRGEEIEELQRYLDMNPDGPAVQVARDLLDEAQSGPGS